MTRPTPKKKARAVRRPAQVAHLKTPHPQHFIGGAHCRFWRASVVGRYVVSTVGDYHPPTIEAGPVDIGWRRKYETYVFKAGRGRLECGCANIRDYSQVDALPANDRATAGRNHMRLVRKWSRAQEQKKGRKG